MRPITDWLKTRKNKFMHGGTLGKANARNLQGYGAECLAKSAANISNVTIPKSRVYAKAKDSIYILLSKDYVSYCSYENKSKSTEKLTHEEIIKALNYSINNDLQPIFVHSQSEPLLNLSPELSAYNIKHIMAAEFAPKAHKLGFADVLPIFNKQNIEQRIEECEICVLNITQGDIAQLYNMVKRLFKYANRVNINIAGLDASFDEQEYEKQLSLVEAYILQELKTARKLKELNVLTEVGAGKYENCQPKENTFAIGTGGLIFACPAFYSAQASHAIGNYDEGVTKKYNARLYNAKDEMLCAKCDSYQCSNCVHTNYINAKDIYTCPSAKCKKSYIERKISQHLFKAINCIKGPVNSRGSNYVPTLGSIALITAYYESAGKQMQV